ncbi:MAG TPA: glycosyltransferase family 2 protein [Thermoanaerobaculia bacterium]|nr:glycosyltransferase family 2 protein [Thermoanaerobaculia bacterium]
MTRLRTDVTPVLLTADEEANLHRTLAALTWAQRVVVLDSCSDDATPEIARSFANVSLHQRAFDDHTTQWNHALSLVETPWALSLDADYVVQAEGVREMEDRLASEALDGYWGRFVYCVWGRPLRAALYPPRLVLFRLDRARYEPDGHTQRLRLDGEAGNLLTPLLHDDRKPLSRWLEVQARYAALEAGYLARTSPSQLGRNDRLRRRLLGPFLVLPYCLLGKGLLFGGRAGWFYSLQRLYAEVLLALALMERQANPAAGDRPA